MVPQAQSNEMSGCACGETGATEAPRSVGGWVVGEDCCGGLGKGGAPWPESWLAQGS